VSKADNLTTILFLNFLEPSGPFQACDATALPFTGKSQGMKPRCVGEEVQLYSSFNLGPTSQAFTPWKEKRYQFYGRLARPRARLKNL